MLTITAMMVCNDDGIVTSVLSQTLKDMNRFKGLS